MLNSMIFYHNFGGNKIMTNFFCSEPKIDPKHIKYENEHREPPPPYTETAEPTAPTFHEIKQPLGDVAESSTSGISPLDARSSLLGYRDSPPIAGSSSLGNTSRSLLPGYVAEPSLGGVAGYTSPGAGSWSLDGAASCTATEYNEQEGIRKTTSF